MQSAPDGEFKWIMHYQDHLTKFSYLRALPNKKASRVALELLKIFLMQGAPMILQSDNGSEFIASIIQDLKDLWPACHIVHGRARHPQSQGSVERGNQDIESMINLWLLNNKTTKWSLGVHFNPGTQ